MAPQQVVVFIDEKNVYRDARRAFFDRDAHHTRGQFHPVALADLICSRLPHGVKEGRELREVRLYTGIPSSTLEPKSYGAHMRQSLSWEAAGAKVVSRALRYSRNQLPGEQKGIDVALAVDFVTMAIEGEYDLGIIFSTDTDLRPALEYVAARRSTMPEVACWWSETAQKYLSISSAKVWSHRLIEADYKSICDYTDYNVK